jgi:beta-mannosidase
MHKQSLNGAWQFYQAGSEEWLPAVVPGGAHTDLLAAGHISDPFVADNELRVQWVADADWTYRRTFQVSQEMLDNEYVELVCDGLDTLAEVRLNGTLLGAAENAFRQYRWQVKDILRFGENELVVDFASATRFCAARNQERLLNMANDALPGAPYLRKAPCHFGWDWGPKLPTVGIWRDIRLEGSTTARLVDVHIRQRHENGSVSLDVQSRAAIWGSGTFVASVSLTHPDGRVTLTQVPLVEGLGQVHIPVEAHQLWWPNGYGLQPLYYVEIILLAEAAELDRRQFQIGLRTLELSQQLDEWGRSFTFVVNGVPIFAKGANWIPSDSFATRLNPAHLEHLIRSSALANQNMLRVWGGGYYEDEIFYDLCDRYGFLVWQDFMFACAIYPFDDPAFVENVRHEVVYNVRRLRHRACLALWCGNNEMEAGWAHWGWSRPDTVGLKEADMIFFYKTLPAWVNEEDPDHAYWPSSPSSGLPHEIPDSPTTGDRHLWEVWHGNKPFRYYRQQFPRFASEFGFQSLPGLQTIATYADSSEWNMTSYIMEHHQRNRAGNSKIITYLTDHYQLPKDFSALVYTTQVLQAEAMRIAVEHWRRHRARCSGALYWQLNDCWPVASWSSIDYYGRWKALHYAARRFFNPLLLSIEDEDTRMGLFITNDRAEPWQGELRWTLEMLSGEVLDSGQQTVIAAPLETTTLLSLDFSGLVGPHNARRVVFVAELWQSDACLAHSLAPFVPDKHLELAAPHLDVFVSQAGNQLSVRLQAHNLARFVELSLEGADVIFSDNYFDLPAGRTVTITCPLPEGWDIMQAKQLLKIRSLKEAL